MFQATESPYPRFTHYAKYIAVLLASIAIHMVLFWLAGHHLLGNDSPDTTTKPKTFHLSLTPVHGPQPQTHAQQETSSPVTADTDIPPTQKPARSKAGTQVAAGAMATNAAAHGATSTRILATARDLARSLSRMDTTETKEHEDPVAAALAKAFDPQAEPSGVSALSDGTIRVVTKQGITYCIRPRNDPGIAGPEDAISLAVTCN